MWNRFVAAAGQSRTLQRRLWPSYSLKAIKTMSTTINMGSQGCQTFRLSGARYMIPRSKSVSLPYSRFITNKLIQERAAIWRSTRILALQRHSGEWLRAKVKEYEDSDDVFQPAFLSTVIFLGSEENNIDVTDGARKYLGTIGNERFLSIASLRILPGPYAIVSSELREVWKLMDDTNGTCMTTLKPQEQ